MKIYFAMILVFIVGAVTFGQDAAAVELKKAEMKKLDKLAGQWKGSGWSQYGAKREPFTGGELVQKKVDGTALLVEGKFTNSEGKVIHETLAVMAYDDRAKAYKFNTYLANGSAGLHDLKLLPDGYEWGFQTPAGTVRFTIKIDSDTWFEIGEFSRDGKTWIRTFEMKLEKVK